ncbi:hypothetical protein P154DRAFT_258260 [Amniculicola lignicola CBS 123094]|uniref:Uncharacterized protein n=1 Tax=Amniculicola lignicola CBS 123094 TaxID=1392246 RepID=A0A6A5WZY2_9PLEO|nr:hypothetical protein P154DRAFT_258260 [Amniculicola lignicola CBS 123094]
MRGQGGSRPGAVSAPPPPLPRKHRSSCFLNLICRYRFFITPMRCCERGSGAPRGKGCCAAIMHVYGFTSQRGRWVQRWVWADGALVSRNCTVLYCGTTRGAGGRWPRFLVRAEEGRRWCVLCCDVQAAERDRTPRGGY